MEGAVSAEMDVGADVELSNGLDYVFSKIREGGKG